MGENRYYSHEPAIPVVSMPGDDFRAECVFKGPGFAETLYLGTSGGKRVIRKASNPDALPFSRTALVREIRLLANLPDELRTLFPPVIRTNLGGMTEDDTDLPDIIFYDMPYYEPEDGWRTLSGCFLDMSLGIEESHRIIDDIVDTVFRYLRLDPRPPDDGYVERTMLSPMRESLAWAENRGEFCVLMEAGDIFVNGRHVPHTDMRLEAFRDTDKLRRMLMPRFDRFLHGDFFPENILYNDRTGQWLLMDPVSVRGVFRGDFVLDLNKMDDWLSGELPALRSGSYTVECAGKTARLDIQTTDGNLINLHRLGLVGHYRERLNNSAFSDIFAEESGWEKRWRFVKAFYCICMLPLTDTRQAMARYLLACDALDSAGI